MVNWYTAGMMMSWSFYEVHLSKLWSDIFDYSPSYEWVDILVGGMDAFVAQVCSALNGVQPFAMSLKVII